VFESLVAATLDIVAATHDITAATPNIAAATPDIAAATPVIATATSHLSTNIDLELLYKIHDSCTCLRLFDIFPPLNAHLHL
jgi:hypothetical protein